MRASINCVKAVARAARPMPSTVLPPAAAIHSLAGPTGEGKTQLVQRLLQAKESSGKSFTQIAKEIGCSNVYTAQLFYNQSQLHEGQAGPLKAAVPGISEEDLKLMTKSPTRRYDPQLIQEPTIYRLHEAVMHGGDALKALINEECGDGIMSAIDFYCNVETVDGKHGEKRVVITLNGKYLPFVVQKDEDDVTRSK